MKKNQLFNFKILIVLIAWAILGLFRFEYSTSLEQLNGHYVNTTEINNLKCVQKKYNRAVISLEYKQVRMLVQIPDGKCDSLMYSTNSSLHMSFYIFNNTIYEVKLNEYIVKSYSQVKHFINLYSFFIYIFPLLLYLFIKMIRFYLYGEKLRS